MKIKLDTKLAGRKEPNFIIITQIYPDFSACHDKTYYRDLGCKGKPIRDRPKKGGKNTLERME